MSIKISTPRHTSRKTALENIKRNSPRGRAEVFRDRAIGFMKEGNRKGALDSAEKALSQMERAGDLVSYKRFDEEYRSIKAGRNPYGVSEKKDVLYSVAFIVFAFGGLILLGNVTGHVVGSLSEGASGLVGFVLVVLGVLGALIFARGM